MSSRFTEAAEQLDRLSTQLAACHRKGLALPAELAGDVAEGLKEVARLIRIGDRQRLAALQAAGNPVGSGVTVVLQPFDVVQGGRA